MNGNHYDMSEQEVEEAQLTAYAFGQLDPGERAEVEARLARSENARRLVEVAAALAEHVCEANREGPSMQPSAALREAVEERLNELEDAKMSIKDGPLPAERSAWRRWPWRRLALAACLLIAAIPLWLPSLQSAWDAAYGPAMSRGLEGQDHMEDATTGAAGKEFAEPPVAPVLTHTPADPGWKTTGGPQLSTPEPQPAPVAGGSGGRPGYTVQSAPGQYPSTSYTNGHGLPGPSKSSSPEAYQPSYQTPPIVAGDRRLSLDYHGDGGVIAKAAMRSSAGGPNDRYATAPMVVNGVLSRDKVGGEADGGQLAELHQATAAPERQRARQFALSSELNRAREILGRFERSEQGETPGTEQYDLIVEHDFVEAAGEDAVSTFSVDVDTASYANVRRFLNQGRLPPPSAVRIEEMVNYFKYGYPLPEGEVPFAVDMEVAQCPWNGGHRLLRIGLKGQEIDAGQRGPSNLVFLLDVSGSMRDENKLPLVREAMTMLVDQLGEDDRVAIVTYAGEAALRLPSAGGEKHETILSVIESLTAAGSTHGSAGIQLAYQQAAEHFVSEGTNRVILCTDGDLNVGITDDDALVRLIQQQAKSGVFLTVLGFGTGNLKDSKMEKLADKGNGTYAYIDGLREAKRVLVEQLSGSLVTIAKDVKVQVIFNPAEVHSYRLIGYENRVLATPDFNDDKKDAGEIGAGHTVTALYEIVPAGTEEAAAVKGPDLKYQRVPKYSLTKAARSGELLTLRLRYKQPDGLKSKLLEFVVGDEDKRFGRASADFRFASAVASFGMVLRGSKHCGNLTLLAVEEFAAGAVGEDPGGYRQEFIDLVRRARQLMPR